ncbi:hypothetical protein GGI07_000355 [Coemansia sp. Benny D115]|nr:hypothetical protein GGI07_000355 [Coemansia sp. Benny D115]
MCVTFWTTSFSDYDLVLAFNRDEFFGRPTQGFHRWAEHPGVFAPKDLQPESESQRGSWIGLNTETRRLAMLTNFREPHYHTTNKISRGALVRNFLLSQCTVDEYAHSVYADRRHYDGFNLVLFDLSTKPVNAVYLTNRGNGDAGELRRVEDKRVVGLSNSTLGNPWPKVERGREAFLKALEAGADADADTDGAEALAARLWSVMQDAGGVCCEGQGVPQTVDDLKEHVFIPTVDGLGGTIAPGEYGTRTTDVIMLRNGVLTVAERNYRPDGTFTDVLTAPQRLGSLD